jgi:hypothetical protein
MKSLIAILSILGMVGLVVGPLVYAENTATITATVTVQNISVSVSDGSIAYGIMAANSTKSTCDLNDTQTVTNDGNIAETFNIKGQNSANWTLADTAGTDQYVHKFAASSCPWTNGTPLTTSYQTMATNIPPNGNSPLNLQITTPNPSTVFTEQSVNVTVQAVAYQ